MSMASRLPVLYVLDSHTVGGAEFAWLDVVEQIDRSRVEARFVCPAYPAYDPVVERAVRAGVRCVGRFQVEHTLDVPGRRRFGSLFRHLDGVVHFNQNKPDSCRHAIAIARGCGLERLVSTVHDFVRFDEWSTWRRWRCSRAFRSLDHVVAVSTALRRHVNRIAPSVACSVLPNFVHPARVERARALVAARDDLRRSFGLPPGRLVAVSVATLLGRKGQDDLVELLPRLLERRPGAVLLLVGADHDGHVARMQARARTLGCEASLRFAGWRDDVLEPLVASDVLVHAPQKEGLSRVVLEAMTAALPVVAHRVGGIVDLVEDGRTGRLVELGDAAALVEQVATLLDDADQAARFGAAGRARVEREFAPAAVLGAYHDLYDRVARREPLVGAPTPFPTQSSQSVTRRETPPRRAGSPRSD